MSLDLTATLCLIAGNALGGNIYGGNKPAEMKYLKNRTIFVKHDQSHLVWRAVGFPPGYLPEARPPSGYLLLLPFVCFLLPLLGSSF